MLAYLDRMPPELDPPVRLCLMAIRLWGTETRQDRCPVGLLRQLFARFHRPGALWPTHNFLYWTLAHAARPVRLGCPCCGRVADDEALLLAAIFAETAEQARAALTPLVIPIAADRAARMARCVGGEFSASKNDAA